MYAVGYHRQDRGWSRDVYAVGFYQQDRVGPGPGHVRCGLPSAGQGRSRGMYAVGYHRQDRQDRVGPGPGHVRCLVPSARQGRSRGMYAVGYHQQDRVGPRTCTLWGNISGTRNGCKRMSVGIDVSKDIP
ncbi:hypothetical protein Bbelb_253850 [Branchiostoma belcheri]|nr:hypothetical protein Bbelb_253850 [Branchiostoma belcheri]